MTVQICVLCGCNLRNEVAVVGVSQISLIYKLVMETPYSGDTVCREL